MVAAVSIFRDWSVGRLARLVGALAGVVAFGCGGPGPAVSAEGEHRLEIPRFDGGTASPSASGIRFGRVAAVPGTKWAVTVTARSELSDPQGGEQISEYLSKYDVEVLAIEGPAASRLRVAFRKNVQTYQGSEKPTEIDGKTYVVDATAPYVREESGAAAPEAESERVRVVFPDLGTRARIDQVLPEDAIAIGERRDELAAAILHVIHPRAWTLLDGNAAFTRVDSDDGIFSVAIGATSANGHEMRVSGEARIRLRDARLSSLALDGTYETKSSGGSRGSFKLRRLVEDR